MTVVLAVSPVNGLMFHSAFGGMNAPRLNDFSSLKTAIKGDVSTPVIQARMDDRAEVISLGIPLGEM